MSKKLQKMYQLKKIDENRAEMLVYGEIGERWAEVTPKQFKTDLDSVGDVDYIDVRVHCPGGSVTSGYVIHNLLKQHKAYITAYIDGMAASMGAFLLNAADKIVMFEAGFIMIHNPWGFAMGEADEIRNSAKLLDQMRDIAIDIHSKRTGLDKEKIKQMMKDTTYLSAKKALELGFIDEILDGDSQEDSNIDKATVDIENKMLYISGQQLDISQFDYHGKFMQKIPQMLQQGDIKIVEKKIPNKPKGAKKMNNLEELKQKHPEIYQQAIDEGKQAGRAEERSRMKAIDDIALPGTEEIVQKMKYDDPKSSDTATSEIVKVYKQSLQDNPNPVVTQEPKSQTTGEKILQQMAEDGKGPLGEVPGTQQTITDKEKSMARAGNLANLMEGGR